MRHLDLFSGIGGFALAASWVWGEEHEIVSFCEIDTFCQKTLKRHWPNVPIVEDIRNVRGDFGTIDLLTGGFPCQPFSVAGKQKGKEDNRYLWPKMLRVIEETKPNWIIGENVAGIISMALDQVLFDLEALGYEVQAFVIPACAVDAPHKRDRVWIVGRTKSNGNPKLGGSYKRENRTGQMRSEFTNITSPDVANTNSERPQGWPRNRVELGEQQTIFGQRNTPHRGHQKWLPEPNVGRVAHGIPNRVDRLKALGNAIVPQVVVPIMQAIKDLE